MRERRFKAWDSNFNRFIYTDWNSFRNWYTEEKGGKVIYPRGSSYEKGYLSAPMQFIGLKDKNGKDIYKMDILEGIFPNHPNRNFNNGIVIWAKVRCAFVIMVGIGENKNYHDLTSCDINGSVNEETMTDFYMEIVGNIYETPNCLTKNKCNAD